MAIKLKTLVGNKLQIWKIRLKLFSLEFGHWDAIKDFKMKEGITPVAIGDIKGSIEYIQQLPFLLK